MPAVCCVRIFIIDMLVLVISNQSVLLQNQYQYVFIFEEPDWLQNIHRSPWNNYIVREEKNNVTIRRMMIPVELINVAVWQCYNQIM